MLNTNLPRMHQIGVELLCVLEALYGQVAVGSINPFRLWRLNGKKLHEFFIEFFLSRVVWGVKKPK